MLATSKQWFISAPSKSSRHKRSRCSIKRRRKSKNAYTERDELLLSLGFDSYRDYLGSPAWAVIRSAKLANQPLCEICGSAAEEIHHLSYSHSALTGRSESDLVSVCRSHHVAIEFTPHHNKRTFDAARKYALKALGR